MSDPLKYLTTYKINQLYINKTEKNIHGKFITVVNEIEDNVGRMQISPKIKLAITATYIDEKKDIVNYTITKFQNDKVKEKVCLSNFGIKKILEFSDILQNIDLQNTTSAKISVSEQFKVNLLLDTLDPNNFHELLDLLKKDSRLTKDIFALSHKKEALFKFKQLLKDKPDDEAVWQSFFQDNSWIFGHGLSYVFLHSVYENLEQTTTGFTHQTAGKRIDENKSND